MAMYEPICLPPNADEQDFIQAYENVREKYKGKEKSQEGGGDDRCVCVCVFVWVFECVCVCGEYTWLNSGCWVLGAVLIAHMLAISLSPALSIGLAGLGYT